MTSLARFEDDIVAGVEHLHVMGVVGPEGAITTWFSDTVAILGHSVCDGATYHSALPIEFWEHSHDCSFVVDGIFPTTWCQRGSMLFTPQLVKLYDARETARIWSWLGEEYIALRQMQVENP